MVKMFKLTIKYKDGHSNTISKRFPTERAAAEHFFKNYSGKPHIKEGEAHK